MAEAPTPPSTHRLANWLNRPLRPRTILLCMLTLLGALAAVVWNAQRTTEHPLRHFEDGPQPSDRLSPAAVVMTQLAALRRSDTPLPDAGIAIAFRFASPANRAQVGPLERFIELVKAEPYNAMLGHRSVELGPMLSDGRIARQPVRLITASGGEAVFLFILSKQTAAPVLDCWMTDAVIPVSPTDAHEPRPRHDPRGEPI